MTIHLLARSKRGLSASRLEAARTEDIRSRDRDVWNELVSREHQRLFNLHLRLCGDRETAADLTQETFKAAYESCDKFAGRCAVETWLYAVGMNANRNWWRKNAKAGRLIAGPSDGPPSAAEEEGLADPAPTPEQLALLHEQSHLVYEAVAALPETYREAVALRYFAGVPAVEIAAAGGLPAETVRWRVHRGLQLLWAALAPQLGKEQNHDTATN